LGRGWDVLRLWPASVALDLPVLGGQPRQGQEGRGFGYGLVPITFIVAPAMELPGRHGKLT
jgi:hypothetical protein